MERAVLERRPREGYGGGGSCAVESHEMVVDDGEDGGIGWMAVTVMMETQEFEIGAHTDYVAVTYTSTRPAASIGDELVPI
jgi:hypothetical protein